MKGGKAKRISLDTSSLQIAKEKLRQLESSFYRGDAVPFPTKTPIPDAVSAYIKYMQTVKTARSVIRDLYYLREAFGQVCPELKIKNEKISAKAKKCKVRGDVERIEANYFEQITTAEISAFIATQVRRKGLKAKSANRFREILTRLFNWSMQQNGLILPCDKNPAAKVERYRESAPEISFLKLDEIEQQLKSLEHLPDLQVMVAMYIYAGLRREELCWLTVYDVDFAAGGNGMIRVRAKTVNGEFWEPKTKVNRVVIIIKNL
jgi:integrase